jgi:hypothetical protein
MTAREFLKVAAVANVVACCIGCGGSAPGHVPVEGTITLDGAPLEGVQVLFDRPDLGPNENIGYAGKTNAQGRYVLRVLAADGEGVPPGNYRVNLTTSVTADPSRDDSPMTPERIPPAYRGGKLSFEVPADGTDKADFALKSR